MLTEKQRTLLEFIDQRLAKDGVPPSFEEMKDALNLRSKSGIHRLITALEERGFIRRLPHKARALEILRRPEDVMRGAVPQNEAQHEAPGAPATSLENLAIELPVMGRIAAGLPIEAIEHRSASVVVPNSMVGPGQHFALEVRGDSMIDLGINDGDVVVVRETQVAKDGDVVVALVKDQEATLKVFRRSGDMIALEAANPAYETKVFRATDVKIQGQLAGLIRSY